MTMGRQNLAIVCGLIVWGSGGVVRAEDAPLPDLGTRVRVTSKGRESPSVVGTLTALDKESLSVLPAGGGEPRVLGRSEVARLERSVQPSRRGRGALIGLGLGLAAAVGKVAIQGGCNDGCNASNVVVGGLVALSGATIGALAAPGERWADVPVDRQPTPPRISFRDGPDLQLVPQVGKGIGLVLVASF